MVGLSHNDINCAMDQFRKLFKDQRYNCSIHANSHWENVERIGLINYENKKEWEYIPLKNLLTNHFVTGQIQEISKEQLDELSLSLEAYRLVFINGRFSKKLSDIDTGHWKINVEYGINRQVLPEPIQSDFFLHLTESLSFENTRILLPKDSIAEKPLYLLHINKGDNKKEVMSNLNSRHHLEMDSSSKGQLIEHFVSLDDNGYFFGTRTSIFIKENSHLDYVKLAFENQKSYHFAHNDIILDHHVIVCSNTFIFSYGFSSHKTSSKLNGIGSEISINSLSLPSKYAFSENRTYLEHNHGYCLSRQLHKTVAIDHGSSVFHGLIKVTKNSLKTDGKMINNNLLLDEFTKISTVPQLEIYTDDVKCTHGATTGFINNEQIFYLCSRGISYSNARKMIICAFASEVAELVSNDKLRNEIYVCIFKVLKRLNV